MSSLIHLPKLPAESVEQLKKLYSELNPPFVSSFHRRIGNAPENQLLMGSAGIKSLSVYKDTRWFKWTAEQRARFKTALANQKYTSALVGYFIEFPKNKGFLDIMEVWRDQGEGAAIIIAHALNDGQHIIIDGKKTVLQSGEGIAFRLSSIHEVKKSIHDALWANTMVLGKLSDLA